MKRDDWMLFSLTFLTGLAIGMYVYIVAFKPTYTPDAVSSTETEANEWSMVGKRRAEGDVSGYVYPSFRLLGDGSYVYLPGGTSAAELTPVDGRLSSSLLRQLRSEDDLVARYSVTAPGTTCDGGLNGYDYEYRVVMDGTAYTLDTCHTMLGQDSGYALLLDEVWAEIEGTDDTRTASSAAGWLQDWIRRNLGVE